MLDHPFFTNADPKGIFDLKIIPEFIPPVNKTYEPLSNLMPVRPYNGDQKLFDGF